MGDRMGRAEQRRSHMGSFSLCRIHFATGGCATYNAYACVRTCFDARGAVGRRPAGKQAVPTTMASQPAKGMTASRPSGVTRSSDGGTYHGHGGRCTRSGWATAAAAGKQKHYVGAGGASAALSVFSDQQARGWDGMGISFDGALSPSERRERRVGGNFGFLAYCPCLVVLDKKICAGKNTHRFWANHRGGGGGREGETADFTAWLHVPPGRERRTT